MYYPDSYHTVLGSLFDTKEIISSLKKLLITSMNIYDGNVQKFNDIQPFYLTGVNSLEDEIPVFPHSIFIENEGKRYIFTDLRYYINASKGNYNDDFIISNRNEYEFAINRSLFNLLWLGGDDYTLRVRLDLANIVYSTIISDSVSKAYSLNFQDRQTINIAFHYFYQSLFVEEMTDEFKNNAIAHTIKDLRVNSSDVEKVVASLSDVNNIDDICNKLKDIVETNRLIDFNLPVLLTLMRYSWFGINAKDYIAIGLEFPPTWIALVHIIVSQKTYKKTPIAKVAEIVGKRGKLDNFIKEINQINNELISVSMESLTEDDLDYRILE